MGFLGFGKKKESAVDPAEELKRGLSLVKEGKYDEASSIYKTAAEHGETVAMLNLADLYYYGKIVSKQEDSLEWYSRAAEHTNPEANAILFYINKKKEGKIWKESEGYDYTQDLEPHPHDVALDMFVDEEIKVAQSTVVDFYGGLRIDISFTDRERWICIASDMGYTNAMVLLGDAHEYDDPDSFKYYKESAEKGNAFAAEMMWSCYNLGNCVERSETEAHRWLLLAAERGNLDMQVQLAEWYLYDDGSEQAVEEAIKWYYAAATSGSVGAMNELGDLCSEGEFVEQSDEDAEYWYAAADKQGDTDAQTYYDAIKKAIKGL